MKGPTPNQLEWQFDGNGMRIAGYSLHGHAYSDEGEVQFLPALSIGLSES